MLKLKCYVGTCVFQFLSTFRGWIYIHQNMFIMKVNAKIARVNRVRAISFVKESSNFILCSEVIVSTALIPELMGSNPGLFWRRIFLMAWFRNGMVVRLPTRAYTCVTCQSSQYLWRRRKRWALQIKSAKLV